MPETPGAGPGGAPWSVEEDAARLPAYALTGGRTHPSRPLELATLIKARHHQPPPPSDAERQRAVDLCRQQPLSVAEIAARLARPAHITKIVLAHLIDTGHLTVAMPATSADPTDPDLLEALLAGLQQLTTTSPGRTSRSA